MDELNEEISSQEDEAHSEDLHVCDAFDSLLLHKCARLLPDRSTFLRLSKEQKMLVYLVSKNSKESTHVEFKSSMMSEDIDFRMLRSACSMYNGLQPSLREPSIMDPSRQSSYVIYGIEEEDRKTSSMKKNFHPLVALKGEEEIQDLFNSSTHPQIEVYFHRVHFETDMIFEAAGCIRQGTYGLLEIPAGECGPVCFRNKSKRKSQLPKAGSLLLYTRSDAKNLPEEEWDQSTRERVFSQFKQRFDAQALFLVSSKLEARLKWFRVLIMTRFTGAADSAEKEKLARALGRGKWEMIIDFDRDSRMPDGSCALIEEEMNKQGRLYSLKAWTELSEKFESSDLEECQRGDRTIYIQANGCKLRSISEPKNPAKVKKLIRSNALEPVFEKNLTPKPVICLSLFITATYADFTSSTVRPDILPGLLKDAYESESGSSNEFQLITLYTNETVKNSVQTSASSESYVAPANQICSMLNSMCPSDCPKQEYELPGVSSVFSITRESFACYKPYLRLYHIKSGEKDNAVLNSKSKDEKAIKLIREFLFGSELTKEMLYLNERLEYENSIKRVYAKRRQMEKLKNRVKIALDHCKNRTAANYSPIDNQIVRFPHDPLSGATTIARVVLWQLRQDYPCVEVKGITKLIEIINAVRFLFKESGLPVLILFDSHAADFFTVQTFVSELRLLQPSPLVVVLFAEQVAPGRVDPAHQSLQPRSSQVLTMELNEEEKEAFTAIYDSVGGDLHLENFANEVGDETECTPFLFGVWYFKQDYRRIQEFVELLLTDIDDNKKRLLFFASVVQRFTHAPLVLAIAAHCVGLSPAQGDPSQTLDFLGKQRHLLTVQKRKRDWLGFAPVFEVGSMILNCLFAEISDNEKEKKILGRFIQDISDMAESPQLLPCLQKLVQDLLTCNKRLLDPKKLFTDFIMTISNLCTLKEELTWAQVEEIFLKLAEVFSEKRSHVLIHCARLFSYEPNDYEKSLELVRKALDLKDAEALFMDTECNDDVVLGLSAHLINCRLNSGKPLPFDELQRLACESMSLCQKAQEKRRYSKFYDGEFRAHPFCNEIQAQRVLLNKFFTDICNSKTETYFKKLQESQYVTVLRTHETILDNIFKLEDMYEDRKVRPDTFTQRQMSKLIETKMEFIKRCYPHAEKTELSTFPFEWVAVEYYLRERNSVSHPTASFEADDFSADENVCFFGRWDRGWEIRHLPRKAKEKLLEILLSCKSKLAKNYFELCILLITLKPPNALDLALQVSHEWCRKHESDFLAHFMHGAFLLAKALSSDDSTEKIDALRRARNSLDACNKATVLQSSPEEVSKRRYGSTRPRFIIRKRNKCPIDMLGFFPRKQQHGEQKGSLSWRLEACKFTGSLQENRGLKCHELPNWLLTVPKESVQEEMIKKKSIVSFALTLSFVSLVPIEIK